MAKGKILILIGCRLPHGLTLTHPISKTKITLGSRFSLILGSNGQYADKGYSTTEVDTEFWDTWKIAYRDYAPLKSGAIFEAVSASEAKEKAKDLESEKTGFESMDKDSAGIKSADKE